MARRVFFSFHYADIMNANIVRNCGQFTSSAETGFYDRSLWERAKTQGDAAVKELINRGLNNTSVTVFLIGQQTRNRPYCIYERDRSINEGKGLLGIHLPNETGTGPSRWLEDYMIPVYRWDHTQFGSWVERAAQTAGR